MEKLPPKCASPFLINSKKVSCLSFSAFFLSSIMFFFHLKFFNYKISLLFLKLERIFCETA